jgi:hypothetical protein
VAERVHCAVSFETLATIFAASLCYLAKHFTCSELLTSRQSFAGLSTARVGRSHSWKQRSQGGMAARNTNSNGDEKEPETVDVATRVIERMTVKAEERLKDAERRKEEARCAHSSSQHAALVSSLAGRERQVQTTVWNPAHSTACMDREHMDPRESVATFHSTSAKAREEWHLELNKLCRCGKRNAAIVDGTSTFFLIRRVVTPVCELQEMSVVPFLTAVAYWRSGRYPSSPRCSQCRWAVAAGGESGHRQPGGSASRVGGPASAGLLLPPWLRPALHKGNVQGNADSGAL